MQDPPARSETGDADAVHPNLARLEAVLRRQCVHVTEDRRDGFSALCDEARSLMQRAAQLPKPLSDADRDCLRRIDTLYRKLSLTVADQRMAVARKLRTLSHGRTSIAAYQSR